MHHARLLMIACLAACKINTPWTGGTTTSGSGPAPSGQPASGGDGGGGAPAGQPSPNKDKEYSEINSAASADAWYKRHATAEVRGACGINVAFTVDFKSFEGADYPEPKQVVGESQCGNLPKAILNVCEDATGKTAIQNLRAVHCERLVGKATVGAFKIMNVDGNKHAYAFEDGKLTVKLGGHGSNSYYWNATMQKHLWPIVRWQRDVDAFLGGLQRHFTNWSEDKDGVDFKVDIDPVGFASVNYMWAFYTCGGNGNSGFEGYSRSYPESGKLAQFLGLLWDNAKGKQLLKKVRRVTCSATDDPDGRTPELDGDRLIFYGRVLNDHHMASHVTGFEPNRIPEHDANFAFAKFRKAQNLGGECPWPRRATERDPEGMKVCP